MNQFDVALVGEFNVDLLLYGLPESLPTERELLATNMALLLGGSPAITANNLARLGNRVALISARANDIFADFCVKELEEAGVDLSRAVRTLPSVRTGVSVHLQHEFVRRSLTYTGSTVCLKFDDLDLDYLRSARHFHLASFFLQQGLIQDLPRLLALIKEAGLTISLDSNDDPSATWSGPMAECLRFVDVLMPNQREAMALADTDSIEFAIDHLSKLVPLLVVKRGSEGVVAIDRGRRLEQSAFQVQPVDAVGAGDSFNAGFLHGYLKGWTTELCLKMGNLAGAWSTTQIGGTAAFRDHPSMCAFFDAKAPGLFPADKCVRGLE